MEYVKNSVSKFFLVALLLALGCSKELPTASLIGTWKQTRAVAGGCNSSNNNYNDLCSGNCNVVISATTITFPNFSGSYTATGSTIGFTSTGGGGSTTITYQLTPATLIFSFEDSDDGCTYTLYFVKI